MQKLTSYKLLVVIIVCLLSAACSSSFVARTVYGQLDNYFEDSINNYANFNNTQQDIIENAAKRFAKWHRETQLPVYKKFFIKSADVFSRGDKLKRQAIEELITDIAMMGDHFINAPWSLLSALYPTLNESEIIEIGNTLQEDLSTEIDEYEKNHASEKSTKKYRKKQRKKMTQRFESFFDINLTEQQKNKLHNLSLDWIDLRPESFELRQEWNIQAVSLLVSALDSNLVDLSTKKKNRLTIDFLNQATNLERTTYPTESDKNKNNTIDTLLFIFSSANQKQKKNIRESLLGYAELIEKL